MKKRTHLMLQLDFTNKLPENIKRLKKNSKINNLKNVTPYYLRTFMYGNKNVIIIII